MIIIGDFLQKLDKMKLEKSRNIAKNTPSFVCFVCIDNYIINGIAWLDLSN